jgi:Outer membrane lipoprotein carrier protein LolA-like
MRRLGHLIALAFGVALAGSVTAAPDAGLQEVLERLSTTQTVRGEFAQSRDIRALSRPLVSRGRFIVSDLGLYWQQTAPFASVLIADGERLVQSVADQPPMTLRAADQPVALAISEVLLGVFRGHRAELEELFTMRFEAVGEHWSLRLAPRGMPLSEVVQGIDVEGSRYIDRVIVRGRAADELTVTFSAVSTEPDELSSAERDLYAP